MGLTTTKVAEAAGISVGSLYQYYPHKEALLFALHQRDVAEGWQRVALLLEDNGLSPAEKVTLFAVWFFRSEAEQVRTFGPHLSHIDVWIDADPRAHEDPAVLRKAAAFFREASTHEDMSLARAEELTRLARTTLVTVGKAVARGLPPDEELDRAARDVADMVNRLLGI